MFFSLFDFLFLGLEFVILVAAHSSTERPHIFDGNQFVKFIATNSEKMQGSSLFIAIKKQLSNATFACVT
ncbi:hypothetical protein JV197_16450, partial [Vibrio furnissii]